jgi:hypothetical protein
MKIDLGSAILLLLTLLVVVAISYLSYNLLAKQRKEKLVAKEPQRLLTDEFFGFGNFLDHDSENRKTLLLLLSSGQLRNLWHLLLSNSVKYFEEFLVCLVFDRKVVIPNNDTQKALEEMYGAENVRRSSVFGFYTITKKIKGKVSGVVDEMVCVFPKGVYMNISEGAKVRESLMKTIINNISVFGVSGVTIKIFEESDNGSLKYCDTITPKVIDKKILNIITDLPAEVFIVNEEAC